MNKIKSTRDALEYLKNAPLTYEETLKEKPLAWFITDSDEKRAKEEAEIRYKKWLYKCGKILGDLLTDYMKARASYGMLENVLLEILMNKVLRSLGVTGGKIFDYFGLGFAVAKKGKKYVSKKSRKHVEKSLEVVVRGLINEWKIRKGVEEKKARILALACLKLVNYARRKYSDITFEKHGVSLPTTVERNE